MRCVRHDWSDQDSRSIEERVSMLEREVYVELEHKLDRFKNKLDEVFNKMLVLSNAENIIHIESEEWKKIVSRLELAKEDIHKEIRACAQGFLAMGGYRCHDDDGEDNAKVQTNPE